MLEASVEKYLCQRIEALGGYCIKLHPLSIVGIPDRLVLLPGGFVAFVELKRPRGGRYSAKQNLWEKRLKGLGMRVARLKNKGEIDEFLRGYITT